MARLYVAVLPFVRRLDTTQIESVYLMADSEAQAIEIGLTAQRPRRHIADGYTLDSPRAFPAPDELVCQHYAALAALPALAPPRRASWWKWWVK